MTMTNIENFYSCEFTDTHHMINHENETTKQSKHTKTQGAVGLGLKTYGNEREEYYETAML